MNLILFGFKSCGKTTLGKKLSQRLNRPFYDTDHLVASAYEKKTGEHLHFREIYRKVGKEAFSSLEKTALSSLRHVKNSIISVGGSLVLDPQNVTFLEKLGTLVYLKIDKQTLKERILSKPAPAFFDPQDKPGSFEKMYTERAPHYEKILAISIDMENKTETEVLLELEALIQES